MGGAGPERPASAPDRAALFCGHLDKQSGGRKKGSPTPAATSSRESAGTPGRSRSTPARDDGQGGKFSLGRGLRRAMGELSFSLSLSRNKWDRRHFVLYAPAGPQPAALAYFRTQGDALPVALLALDNASVLRSSNPESADFQFSIFTESRDLNLRAPSADALAGWLAALGVAGVAKLDAPGAARAASTPARKSTAQRGRGGKPAQSWARRSSTDDSDDEASLCA